MDYDVWSQVLLELALAASGEQELKPLFKKTTSIFLRKLDCTHIAVLQNIDNKLETVYSIPKPSAKDELFKEVLAVINKEDCVERKKVRTFEGERIYYAYDLEGFGMLLIGREYALKDALVNDLLPITDILAKSFNACIETIKRKGAEAKLKKKVDAQNLLVNLATGFINTSLDDVDDAISNALSLVGSFTNSDRAYLFEYDFENNLMSNTFEWCGENISAQIDYLQNISCDIFTKDWVDKHKKGETLIIPDVEKLNEESPLYKILKDQQIRTLITIPLFLRGECLGFVGFDSVYEKKNWEDDDTFLLKILAELFTNVYLKKEHENRIVQARMLAESANTAKSEFLANMSHEIRTPLNGVVGMLNVLHDTKLTDEQKGYLKMADDSIESLLSIINDILDYSKIEAGMMDLMEEVIDLEQEVQKVLRMLSVKANEKGIELGASLSRFVPKYLLADKMRIRQILLNLVNNAIKFTEKGFVCVKVECKGVKDGVSHLFFEVIDSGVGISEDKLEQIFEQFTQVDGSSSRRYGGTGLGLAICKKMVALMGGSLKAKSKIEKGTVFYFDLKLRVSNEDIKDYEKEVDLRGKKALNIDDNKKENTEKESRDSRLLNGLNVLMVDDNKANRMVAIAILEKIGCRVTQAEDGLSAIEKVENFKYDVVLMDCQMPGIDGYEATKMIRKKGGDFERIPIVALTANAMIGDREKCISAGMTDYVSKPFKRKDLEDVFERVLK